MTLLNIISIVFTVSLISAVVFICRKSRNEVKDANGLGDVNTRGPAGELEESDFVAVLGDNEKHEE